MTFIYHLGVRSIALKFKNKKKRKYYWKKYFRAKTKNFQKIWDILDEIINELDVPFTKQKRGRPPKLNFRVITKRCISIGYFNLTLDEMVGLLDLLEKDTLDRSNIDRWFIKFDDEYARKATQMLHEKIEGMFKTGEYIVDSTKFTSDRYQEVLHKGKITHELIMMGFHLLIVYFPSVGILSISNFFVSPGWSHENPIYRKHLLPGSHIRKGRNVHGDKGFFGKENILASEKNGLNPNFVPKENTKHGLTLKRITKEYNNELRKKFRGLVEGVFGGMETETYNKLRYRLDKTRKTYIALRALSHEIRTYLRALEQKIIFYFLNFATTPV